MTEPVRLSEPPDDELLTRYILRCDLTREELVRCCDMIYKQRPWYDRFLKLADELRPAGRA